MDIGHPANFDRWPRKQIAYFGDEALTQRLGGLNGGNCEPMESQVPPVDFPWKAKGRLPTGSPQVPPAFPQARPSAGNRCAVPTVTRLDQAIIIGIIFPCACMSSMESLGRTLKDPRSG